jgi:hypothetical protein
VLEFQNQLSQATYNKKNIYKMKKIVRLTESDLTRIVKRVIIEGEKKLLLGSNKGSVDKGRLTATYKYYNNLGSEGTFNEIFKNERTQKKQPFVDFVNGCATKVSLALANAGQTVSPAFRTTSGKSPKPGTPIQTSAASLKDELTRKWGVADVTHKGNITEKDLQKKFGKGNTGILICSPCGFGGASGHATIWSKYFGTDKEGGPMDNTTYHLNNPSAEIHIWRVGSDESVNKQ